MAPTRGPNDGLLARVNFPLYAVEMLTSRHVLVAGGGGSSKTGVANGFEIYEIYHDGSKFVAEEVIRHETGLNVVMNFAVKNDGKRSYLVAGQESHCQMYYVNPRILSENEDGEKIPTPNSNGVVQNGKVRRRLNSEKANASGVENLNEKPKAKMSNGVHNAIKKITFEIKAADSIQTDFLPVEPLQRVVKISPNGKWMSTGGTDGVLRVWNFPKMIKHSEISAHSKEIDDIDFSPDSKFICTIAKDGKGLVWDLQKNKLHHKLEWETPNGAKYIFKRCRYGAVEGSKSEYKLFTITNPLGKVGKQKGYLQQWECDTGKIKQSVEVNESLASLAVRDDGRFVAVGTMFSGSVSIYVAFSLQRVLHIPNAHSMFVTGLTFLPVTSQEGPPISSDTEAAVLSISVDNKVCVHKLKYRQTLPAWIATIFIFVVLILSFVLCSYLGI